MDLTLSTSPIVVTIDGGIELEVSPSNVVTVEIGYGDAAANAYILGLLTNNTALGRLSDALAAIDALTQAEAENATSDVVGLATGRRLAQGAAVGDAAHVAAGDPHTQYQKKSEKDAASGYAGLDGSSLLSVNHLGLSASGAFPYRTAAGGIGASLQGTVPLGAYAVDWAAGDMFTKTLAGGDTFTHSNTEAKIAITIRVTNSGGHAIPGGIGTRNPGTAEWDTAWTTVDIYIRKVSGALVYTLSGE